jgi:hypothetical protein
MISAAKSESKFEAEVRKAIKIAIVAIQHHTEVNFRGARFVSA